MNIEILDQKISALNSFQILKPESIKKFRAVLIDKDDWDLFRINPLKFATDHQMEKNESIDLFIASAKIGLFDFNYNLVCPSCGGIEFSHRSIDQIKKETFYCSSCKMDISTALDDQIEVSFTIHSSVKEIALNPYENLTSFRKYFYTRNFIIPQELQQLFNTSTLGFFSLDPDKAKKITLKAKEGNMYSFSSMGNHCVFDLEIKKETADHLQEIQVDLLDGTFSPGLRQLAAGEISVRIKNLTRSQSAVIIRKLNMEKMVEIFSRSPYEIIPWLTGKMLLNNQTFRELFRIQTLAGNLKLNLKSQTVLFTDLRGSTEMYDKAGDFTAYQLVQEHFVILTNIVRKHSGAVVKTMGDAIMATFSHPTDGLLASIEMILKIEDLNDIWKQRGYEIGLKIGLHEGSALAVNADDRIDYFGQAINIAARVQNLAKSGEIWITEPVYNYPGIINKISDFGYQTEMQYATLKGVGQPTTVYKIFK